jgi:hypothetical protein
MTDSNWRTFNNSFSQNNMFLSILTRLSKLMSSSLNTFTFPSLFQGDSAFAECFRRINLSYRVAFPSSGRDSIVNLPKIHDIISTRWWKSMHTIRTERFHPWPKNATRDQRLALRFTSQLASIPSQVKILVITSFFHRVFWVLFVWFFIFELKCFF